MHSTTLSSAALMIWQTLQNDYKLDAKVIFEHAGLDTSQLHNPAYRYADDQISRLWELTLKCTQNECIGIKVAQHIHPTTLNALGFAWLSSATLLEALNRLVRFYKIVTDTDKLELVCTEKNYSLVLTRIKNADNIVIADYDTFFAALVIMCQSICGDEFRPEFFEMERPAPSACENEMNDFFRSPIKFESDQNTIGFNLETINNILPTANAKLARENDQIMTRYLSSLDKNDIVLQVKSRLIEYLPSGLANEVDIADAMHMSVRTLQRKLIMQKTNYKDVSDGTRRELAIEYVREQQVPMTEITFLLGYSDQANFTRAIRRWTGQSPTEFRKVI